MGEKDSRVQKRNPKAEDRKKPEGRNPKAPLPRPGGDDGRKLRAPRFTNCIHSVIQDCLLAFGFSHFSASIFPPLLDFRGLRFFSRCHGADVCDIGPFAGLMSWIGYGLARGYLGSILKTIEVVGGDGFTRFQALHRGHIAVGCAEGHGVHCDGLVGLDKVYKRALGVALYGSSRNKYGVMFRTDQQPHVYKLVGKKRTVLVSE